MCNDFLVHGFGFRLGVGFFSPDAICLNRKIDCYIFSISLISRFLLMVGSWDTSYMRGISCVWRCWQGGLGFGGAGLQCGCSCGACFSGGSVVIVWVYV